MVEQYALSFMRMPKVIITIFHLTNLIQTKNRNGLIGWYDRRWPSSFKKERWCPLLQKRFHIASGLPKNISRSHVTSITVTGINKTRVKAQSLQLLFALTVESCGM
jgi:hypothetical protein